MQMISAALILARLYKNAVTLCFCFSVSKPLEYDVGCKLVDIGQTIHTVP